MRTLHVITNTMTGGAELTLLDLLKGIESAPDTHRVIALVSIGATGEKLKRLGVQTESLGIARGRVSLRAIREIRRAIRQHRAEYVQGWMYHGNIAASVATWGMRPRPMVGWNIRHSLHDIKKERTLTRLTVRLSALFTPDLLINNSQTSAKQHSAIGINGRRNVIIPNGFDFDRFKPDKAKRETVRKKMGIPDNALLFGQLARLHPMKGHNVLLKAFTQTALAHEHCHLLLAGRDVASQDTPLDAQIKALPDQVRNRIHCVDEVSDPEAYFAGIDVIVSPSSSEGFPNALVQGIACGGIGVATDVGDSSAILDDSTRIVPPDDSDGLHRVMMEVAGHDRKMLQDISLKDQARLRNSYSLSNMIESYLSAWKSCKQ